MSNCPHCGCELEQKPKGKPRSVPQHRRYFAMIKAAFSHWPEDHRFQPITEERLRKWLQARAGHAIITSIDLAPMKKDEAISAIAAALITAALTDEHYFTHQKGAMFYVIRSKSISFDELPHLAACALFDAVAEVIEAETDLKVAQIMPPIIERRKHIEHAEVPL
jgi:hypothetical protein